MTTLAYRYRAYPTAAQVERIAALGEHSATLWNLLYEDWELRLRRYREARIGKSAAECKGIMPTRFDWFKALTELRACQDWPSEPCSFERGVIEAYAWSVKSFISGRGHGERARPPRPFGQGRWGPIRWTQIQGSGQRRIARVPRWLNGRVELPGLGPLRVRLHRDCGPVIREARLIRDCGRWYLSVIADSAPEATLRVPVPAILGLDWGTDGNTIALSDGTLFRAPIEKWRKLERAISADLERLVGRRRGSGRRERAREIYKARNLQLRRERDAWTHETSRRIVDRAAVLVVEEAPVQVKTARGKGAARRARAYVNRAVLRVAPASLLAAIRYKCEILGGRLIEVRGPTEEFQEREATPEFAATILSIGEDAAREALSALGKVTVASTVSRAGTRGQGAGGRDPTDREVNDNRLRSATEGGR